MRTEETAMDSGALISTILVVNDVAALQAGISRILEKFGFAVIRARDGGDALMKYNIHHDLISLVILDLPVATLDGIDTIRQIRNINPVAKVIICCNYITQPASEAMPDAFLQKPFNGRDLWEIIQQVLRGERRRTPRIAWA
jgi:two-component system chemotaxis response regulator CheY